MAKTNTTNTKDQYSRFKAAARELGTDESEGAFDRVLRKIGKAKPAPRLKRPKKRGNR